MNVLIASNSCISFETRCLKELTLESSIRVSKSEKDETLTYEIIEEQIPSELRFQ